MQQTAVSQCNPKHWATCNPSPSLHKHHYHTFFFFSHLVTSGMTGGGFHGDQSSQHTATLSMLRQSCLHRWGRCVWKENSIIQLYLLKTLISPSTFKPFLIRVLPTALWKPPGTIDTKGFVLQFVNQMTLLHMQLQIGAHWITTCRKKYIV